MATFGAIGSANPNVLFDPAAAMGAAQQYQRNALLMENQKQDQAAQGYERDAQARITLARQFADAPDDVLAAEWEPEVRRLQAAGLAMGVPTAPPPRERLKQIAMSDLTTFQKLQLEERKRSTEAVTMALGGGAPPAALGGVAAAPADLMPHFQAASAATGVPVPLLVAQAKQESGFNPNATGAAGEVGIMQIKPSTAQQPGYGVLPADPASLRDPAKNIMFGAQYLAARSPGANWNDPAQRDAALGRYNGGGDPNYAANVTRNLPAVGPNGLTQQQSVEARAIALSNPTAALTYAAQARAQNAAMAERAADNARADAAQRATLAAQERAAAVQTEQLRLSQAAARRAEEKDRREAGRLPAKVVELVAETEDKLAGLQGARDALAEARKLSPQAYAGPAADLRGRAAATTGFDSASGTATTQFSSVMTEQALGQLRTIFGGNPTEGERKILLDMMASTTMSRAEREALIKRAEDAVAVREQSARQRLTQLRRGDYGDADPNYTAPQSSAPAAKPEAKADPLEGRTITNGTTGQQMIRRNGKWEPL